MHRQGPEEPQAHEPLFLCSLWGSVLQEVSLTLMEAWVIKSLAIDDGFKHWLPSPRWNHCINIHSGVVERNLL